MEPGDWPQVQGIYQEGIDTGFATFESSAPDWEYFDQSRLPNTASSTLQTVPFP